MLIGQFNLKSIQCQQHRILGGQTMIYPVYGATVRLPFGLCVYMDTYSHLPVHPSANDVYLRFQTHFKPFTPLSHTTRVPIHTGRLQGCQVRIELCNLLMCCLRNSQTSTFKKNLSSHPFVYVTHSNRYIHTKDGADRLQPGFQPLHHHLEDGALGCGRRRLAR